MDEHLSSEETAGYPVGAPRDTMERIRRVFVKSQHLNIRDKDLPYGQMLEDVAILDSIAVLEFVIALEREFGISMEPEFLEFDFLRDLQVLASYIDGRLEMQAGSGSGKESE